MPLSILFLVEVPPGINGLQPNLSLTYNSQAGNGLLGVGWNIAGLSSITRCPKTMVQDGEIRGIKLDSLDMFCLDGQRLTPNTISNQCGPGETEYRTEIDSFSIVCASSAKDATNSGPDYFTVKNRDGSVTEYGRTSDSKVTVVAGITEKTLYWSINEIRDFAGNSELFVYNNNEPLGEHSIDSIIYSKTK